MKLSEDMNKRWMQDEIGEQLIARADLARWMEHARELERLHDALELLISGRVLVHPDDIVTWLREMREKPGEPAKLEGIRITSTSPLQIQADFMERK